MPTHFDSLIRRKSRPFQGLSSECTQDCFAAEIHKRAGEYRGPSARKGRGSQDDRRRELYLLKAKLP